MSEDLHLTLACGDCDRTDALRDGSVKAEGIALNCLRLDVEEIFFRTVRFAEFDVAELSLSSYLLTMGDEGFERFVAIPVFPSRAFRHSSIYVSAASGLERPEDLVGRTVGLAEYQLTANVWIRGILADRHNVPVNSVRYRTGGLHQAGRQEKLPIDLPPDIQIEPIPLGRTLSEMLAAGEIDAVYSPRTPHSMRTSPHLVRRLFDDVREAETQYFRETGIFPIMHTVVIRRDVYEKNRWVARSLQKAFERARDAAWAGMDETASLRYMLPWLPQHVEDTVTALGPDYWPYGVARNAAALDTLVRYSHEQGLARRRYAVEELFAPETLIETLI